MLKSEPCLLDGRRDRKNLFCNSSWRTGKKVCQNPKVSFMNCINQIWINQKVSYLQWKRWKLTSYFSNHRIIFLVFEKLYETSNSCKVFIIFDPNSIHEVPIQDQHLVKLHEQISSPSQLIFIKSCPLYLIFDLVLVDSDFWFLDKESCGLLVKISKSGVFKN